MTPLTTKLIIATAQDQGATTSTILGSFAGAQTVVSQPLTSDRVGNSIFEYRLAAERVQEWMTYAEKSLQSEAAYNQN